jgi:hypothetical protein
MDGGVNHVLGGVSLVYHMGDIGDEWDELREVM